MEGRNDALAGWTPAEIALGRHWVATWRRAGIELERIRRDELRALDRQAAMVLLGSPLGTLLPPPRESSGLVEQQRWFLKAARQL